MARLRRFRTTDGQNLLEYALVGAFVAIVVLAGATGLGSSIDSWFDAIAGTTEEGAKKSHCGGRGMAASHGKCHGG